MSGVAEAEGLTQLVTGGGGFGGGMLSLYLFQQLIRRSRGESGESEEAKEIRLLRDQITHLDGSINRLSQTIEQQARLFEMMLIRNGSKTGQ